MYFSYKKTIEALQSGSVSCVELVTYYITKISRQQDINAFLEIFSEAELIDRAIQIDAKIKNGTQGKLAGMVIGIKDNICYKNHICSASSKILEGFISLYNSTAVERLLAEDAIIIGRLNCDEFAMGGSNENSAYGNVLNPLDKTRVPGGSSGGSAAAVAAGMCLATLGSDTGGSVRQPAAFCGLVGMKPTYGRVSRWGLIAYGSSFDQIGSITHTVEDAALILEVIAGKDDYDSTVSTKEVDSYSRTLVYEKKAKIAIMKECLEHEGLNPEVKKKTEEVIASLKSAGHRVDLVEFPYLNYVVPTYYVLTTAEASSNLSRFDGVRFGYRSQVATDLASTYKKSRSEGFGKEVKRRIMLGTFVLSAGYYDAYYSKAQKVRRLIRDTSSKILKEYDFILSPTTPHTAFEIGKNNDDPISMYLEDIFTVQANLSGQPAISIPVGKHSNGLPMGIQLVAEKFKEADLFAFSHYVSSLPLN